MMKLNLNNPKKILVIFISNILVAIILYTVFSDSFSSINTNTINSKIIRSERAINELSAEVKSLENKSLKNKQSMVDFNVGDQSNLFRHIASNFQDLVIKRDDNNNKGRVYRVSGGMEQIILLIYKTNKYIENNIIQAKVTNFVAQSGGAIFNIEVYGNEDE